MFNYEPRLFTTSEVAAERISLRGAVLKVKTILTLSVVFRSETINLSSKFQIYFCSDEIPASQFSGRKCLHIFT